ncbi:hypothetical protein Q5P01_016468 [Channa striata]|uniref:Uncharacterized protein n=1 Tax=Channa striata TaxID=64152 RepID=A0AA88MFD3_CHASR|nr:hypothetical protein Q5P01_016468 [Channa striata]
MRSLTSAVSLGNDICGPPHCSNKRPHASPGFTDQEEEEEEEEEARPKALPSGPEGEEASGPQTADGGSLVPWFTFLICTSPSPESFTTAPSPSQKHAFFKALIF